MLHDGVLLRLIRVDLPNGVRQTEGGRGIKFSLASEMHNESVEVLTSDSNPAAYML